jgi:hypothetical protein
MITYRKWNNLLLIEKILLNYTFLNQWLNQPHFLERLLSRKELSNLLDFNLTHTEVELLKAGEDQEVLKLIQHRYR